MGTEYTEKMWQIILNLLREKHGLSEMDIKLWLNDFRISLITNDRVIFYTKSNFKRDTVSQRYSGLLLDCVHELLGDNITIKIVSSHDEKEAEHKMVSKLIELNKALEEEAEIKKQLYSTVGDSTVLNHAAVPQAYSEYTFESFVVGNSNKFAHAAAMSVADHPAQAANPLFIYGPSGLGKTHLLYAITDRLKKNFPDYKVVYVKGEEFTTQMIDAISKGLTAEFREKYRQADVLLIDDIQFIAGKASTQEEFFHTFNHLYENGKQIVLASDLPPRDIQRLEERLRTRFEGGVIADINPPDFELRAAIIKKKVELMQCDFNLEVINYIAQVLTQNVRQLEGAVKRIAAQSMLTGADVTVDLAVRSISDQVVGSEPVSVTVEKILNVVSQKTGISVEDMRSRKRTSNIASARHIAIYVIKKLTDSSLPAVGKVFSRDHTTVMNSIETVEKHMASDPSYKTKIKEIIKICKKG